MRKKTTCLRDVQAHRTPRRKGFSPSILEFERRQLLAAGFLQGTVYSDLNNNNAIDVGEAAAGAKVELFDVTGTTSFGVRTTNADGYYLFDGVAPGDYKLVQQPGGGYVGQAAQAVSPTINPILPGGSGAAINIRVTDPESFGTVTLEGDDLFASPYESVMFQIGAQTFAEAIGPLPISLTGSGPATPKFNSYCLDPFQNLDDGTNVFDVVGQEMPPSVNATGNATRIAYLYNRYGTTDSITSLEGGALQLALWELEYDAIPDFGSGNFRDVQVVPGYTDDTPQSDVDAMLARAIAMIAESSGKDARALHLEATGTTGLQSMIATSVVNFKATAAAALGDFVWEDADGDGTQDAGEAGLNGVTVRLLDAGGGVVATTTTADKAPGQPGYYRFADLAPGTYSVQFVAPSGFGFTARDQGANDAIDSDANPAATPTMGRTGPYTLAAGEANLTVDAGLYRLPLGSITSGCTGTIGFWQNKNGQSLILAMNGSATSKVLGNWLATTFPNLYGTNAGAKNLTNKTNTEVADFYVTLFKVQGQKLEAQVLATALATYVTKTSLNSTAAGQALVRSFGFTVDADGTGAKTYNIGLSGAAFGVPNGSILTVSDILKRANDRAVNGLLWNGDTTLKNLANVVFDGINESGDII